MYVLVRLHASTKFEQEISEDHSLVPRLPQFLNVTCRKTREPGKIYHVRDIRWKQLGARHVLTMTQQFLMATMGL